MRRERTLGQPEWLIIAGSGVFILSLAISAVFVPEIRWLHVFQASLYVATSLLGLRHNRWGHFIGISTAGLWNYGGLFGSPLVVEMLAHPSRPDLILQGIAWFANLSVIIGCLWAYSRLPSRPRADIGRFVATFVLTTALLLAATALLAPSYVESFVRMLHPHWPWLRA